MGGLVVVVEHQLLAAPVLDVLEQEVLDGGFGGLAFAVDQVSGFFGRETIGGEAAVERVIVANGFDVGTHSEFKNVANGEFVSHEIV